MAAESPASKRAPIPFKTRDKILRTPILGRRARRSKEKRYCDAPKDIEDDGDADDEHSLSSVRVQEEPAIIVDETINIARDGEKKRGLFRRLFSYCTIM